MNHRITDIKIKWEIGDDIKATTLEDIHIESKRVTIPAGFVTDFASIPKLLHWLLPPYGKYTVAAILHDYYYRTRPEGLTRQEADRDFLDVMREYGVNVWARRTMYYAVRHHGGQYWREPS